MQIERRFEARHNNFLEGRRPQNDRDVRTIGARDPNSSRHLVDLSGVRFAKKEDDSYAIKALIVQGREEAVITQTLRFFAKNAENLSPVAAKQPLLSAD